MWLGEPDPALELHAVDQSCRSDHVTKKPEKTSMTFTHGLIAFRSVIAGLSPALLVVGCGHKAPPPERSPIQVEVVRASADTRGRTFSVTGEVRAKVESDVSFRVSGKVIERSVDVGDEVRPGTVVARLDPTQQRVDVQVSQAAVRSAEAALQLARVEFGREKALLAEGATTQAAYDKGEQMFHSAESTLAAARAKLGIARDTQSYTELTAGRAGVITARFVEVGQVAQAGATAFTLAESGPRDAVFRVQEGAARGLEGQHMELSLADDPSVRARGAVREISPIVDEATGTVAIRVTIEDAPPRMTLRAPIVASLALAPERTFALPAAALTSDQGRPAVWVVDPATMTVSARPVAIAAHTARTVIVRDGVVDGDLVVASGANRLRASEPVSLNGSRS